MTKQESAGRLLADVLKKAAEETGNDTSAPEPTAIAGVYLRDVPLQKLRDAQAQAKTAGDEEAGGYIQFLLADILCDEDGNPFVEANDEGKLNELGVLQIRRLTSAVFDVLEGN